MKVLHVTPRPLPDLRVERAIMSDLVNDRDVHVAAPGMGGTILDIHVKFHRLPFTIFDKSGFRLSRRVLKRIVEDVKPDVIHAHDFPAAYMAKGLAPMIYDSHEDRISTARYRARAKMIKVMGRLYKLLEFVALMYERKNREVAEDVVVVAPSEEIINRYLEAGARKGFVLPNFPHDREVPKIDVEISKEPVHAAVDRPKYILEKKVKFYRRENIHGFPEKFSDGIYGKLRFAGGDLGNIPNVESLGFIPHMKLYEAMADARTLLVPWKPHPIHAGISPNRVYTLIQVGNVPVVPHTMKQVISYVSEAIVFHDTEDFRSKLSEIASTSPEEWEDKRTRVKNIAKKLRWLDDVQTEAYKHA